MKKKFLIIGIVILIVVIGLTSIYKINNTDSNNAVNEIYNKYKEDVDSGVEYLRNSEYFNKMNEDNQVKEMNNLLKLYQRGGIITNLYYDVTSQMYTFVYNYGNIEGALGGVSLKNWDPMMN